MTGIPTLKIHFQFDPQNENEQIELELILSEFAQTATCTLTLPFRVTQIPLLLRALDARQYPDYPNHERLMRRDDNRKQIVTELRELGLWDGGETIGAVPDDVHIRVGRLLGNALLQNDVVKNYLSGLYSAAVNAGEGEIILCFASKAYALATLPWEVTHHGAEPILLTKGVVLNCTRVFLSEYPPLPFHTISKQLRVLTIAPRVQMNETDRAFEQLARSRMHDQLRNLPMVDIELLPQATMDALYKRLDHGPPIQVLDYFGHGVFTSKGGALLLENAQGGRDPVDAQRLAALPNLPPLIVLHACQSAQMDVDAPLRGIATALCNAGVRAVLAMQFTIRMEAVANVAAPAFYRKLAQNKSVQQAVAAVRHELYAVEPDGVSWYVPTLYLHQANQNQFVLLEQPACPPNPFVGQGALGDSTQFIGRDAEEKRLWNRLNALGNLSIIGPAGSGKSTMLALIEAEREKWLKLKSEVVWLPLQRKMKLVEAQLMLARKLGKANAKATDWLALLRGKHLILLLDDIGQLDKGERGLEVRLWLRQLSQDRTYATVQLVSTSMRPLDQIFANDESPDYSSLHNTMKDNIELGAFTHDEARQFIEKALAGTPFQLQQFLDLLGKLLVPRALQEACRIRYDDLCNEGSRSAYHMQ